MNSLSWLIYLAEVLGTFRDAAGIVAGLLIFAVIGLPIIAGPDLFDEDAAPIRKWWKRGIVTAIILAVLAMALPSTRTLYMIAASEIGEKAMATPEAKELFSEVRKTIMQQLKTARDEK